MAPLTAPRRRWSFGLKVLLIAVTLLAVCLGCWESSIVRRRARFMAWLQTHGGSVQIYEPPQSRKPFRSALSLVFGTGTEVEEPHIPEWRKRLGDVPVCTIGLPAGSSESECKQAEALFPEAQVGVLAAEAEVPTGTAGFSPQDDPFSVSPTPGEKVKDPWGSEKAKDPWGVSERPTH